MTFLQPWLLYALPLAGLPILIHLVNLRRHRRVYWGAMMFLLAATRQRRGHTRLRHWLILAARTLALFALIFLISRPLAGRWFSWLGGRPDTIVVVLDRSASMAQQDLQRGISKREAAIEQLASSLETTGMPRSLVLIESSGKPPQTIESPQALRELPTICATDASANLPALLQSALDHLTANQSGRTDVWICSDLQAADWHADGGQWAAIRTGFQEVKMPVRFHLLTYPQPATDNQWIRMTQLQRERTAQQDRLRMSFEIRRHDGRQDAKVPLEIVVDGARSVLEVQLQGEVTKVQDHLVPLDSHLATGWGKLELPQDSNPRDNVYFFSYGDPIQQRTLVVSDQPGSAWPLKLAAAPLTATSDGGSQASRQTTSGPASASAVVTTPDDLAAVEWANLSLILWQAPLPTEPLLSRLTAFIQDGGQVIFFPHAGEETNTVFQTTWKSWEKLAADAEAPSIENWRDDRGLLAHTDAGDPLPVNRVVVDEFRRIEGPGQVLARLQGGAPLLVQIPSDRGGIYFVATLPQPPYSNLARQGIVYFAMVQRALHAGANRLLERQFGVIGQNNASSAESTTRQVVEGWPESQLSTQQTLVAGIYRDDKRIFAQNRATSEDESATLSREQLQQLMVGLNYRLVEEKLTGGQGLVTEIWRFFAVAMLVALIVEGVLCLPDVTVRPQESAA